MKTVLFWDIDGTLLTTGRAGIIAWEDAAEKTLGAKIDLASLQTAGLTDVEVGIRIVESLNQKASPEVVEKLLRTYEDHLPGSLPKRTGQVLPGVRPILEEAKRRSDHILVGLLTGNTRRGAKAKLSYYGIDSFFAFGGFADDAPDRPSIARKALQVARELSPDVRVENVYVIGDTPHDIHCGEAIGARTIAVPFPPYTVENLSKLNPWWTVEKLPEPEIFFKKISLNGLKNSENPNPFVTAKQA